MKQIFGSPGLRDSIANCRLATFAATCKPALLPYPDLGVDVWTISLPACFSSAEYFRSLLDSDEHARAERFRRPEDRSLFIAAHGALRMILAAYADRDPQKLGFIVGHHGKPRLDRSPGSPDIRFNLSHSGDMAAIAVSLGREIGVDIERIEPKRTDIAVAERFFSRREIEALRNLPEKDRDAGFFTCWTRKEAYIKARGEGLSIPLSEFDVSLTPSEPAALLSSRAHPSDAGHWRLQDVAVDETYVAAFAVECSHTRFCRIDER